MILSFARGMDIREPLESGCRPFERSGEQVIIPFGGFFFPVFVFLVDDHLFLFVVVYVKMRVPSAILNLKIKNYINVGGMIFYYQEEIECNKT